MSDSVTITTNTMPEEQLVLFRVSERLRQEPLFSSRMSKEVNAHISLEDRTKYDAAERKAFFRFSGAVLVSSVELKVIAKLMKVGLFKGYLSRLYAKVRLSEVEASSQFLLSHNYPARKIADSVLPVAPDKSDAERCRLETSVVGIMDEALAAAKELNMPGIASILKARKEGAEQRVANLTPQTLG